MSKLLRIAVVGCGRMGKVRAAAAAEFGANVVCVCDANLALANEVSRSLPECKAIESPAQLEWSSLDAVFICTPPSERGPVELAAIEHGVPFLVEKPAGLSAESVSNIAQALAAKPMLTAVGYMNRYRKSVQHVRSWAKQHDVLGMSTDWLVGMYRVPWWSQKNGSGGPVNEQATHLIDLARYLVGEIESVQAMAQPVPTQPDLVGSASINLRFVGGQVCSMLYSCLAKEKMIRLHVYSQSEELALADWDFRLEGDESTHVEYANRNEIFFIETNAFLKAVETEIRVGILSSFEDALKTQRVVDAIHCAIKSGETIRLNST